MVVAKGIVVLFGIVFLFAGGVMLIKPTLFRSWIAKAGSTSLINYGEITIRLIPAIAMVYVAPETKLPLFFQLFEWIMIATSLILYVTPRKIHQQLSIGFAEKLKPIYLQCIAPLAFLIGMGLIYQLF
jgi:hypothetical protein